MNFGVRYGLYSYSTRAAWLAHEPASHCGLLRGHRGMGNRAAEARAEGLLGGAVVDLGLAASP